MNIPERVCVGCGESKPETTEFFRPNRAGSGTLARKCRTCAQSRDPESMREYNRRYRERLAERVPVSPDRKTCKKCGLDLPQSEFRKNAQRADGLDYSCIACARAYKTAWARANPEKRTPVDLTKKKVINKRYRTNNLESARRSAREYNQRNPDVVKASRAKRRAIEKDAEGTHTPADIRARYEAQGGRCWWCGEPVGEKYHVDHIFALANGGSNGPENICISCAGCNLSKNAKTPLEFAGRLF